MTTYLHVDSSENGWVVAPGDVAALQEGLPKALEDGSVLTVNVVGPYAGRLVINAAVISDAALLTTMNAGAIPSHKRVNAPTLQIGPFGERSFVLTPDADLGALESRLVEAIDHEGDGIVEVDVTHPRSGSLWISGRSVGVVALIPAG